MALVKPDETKVVEVADGTITLRAALSLGEIFDALPPGMGTDVLTNPTPPFLRALLGIAVVAWSYEDEVTPANIDRLDIDTAGEVFKAIMEMLYGNPKGEPNKSPSSPTINGLQSSVTSP